MRWLFSIMVMLLLMLWYYRNRVNVSFWAIFYLLALTFIVFTPLSINDFSISVMPPGTGRVSLIIDLWHFSVLENVVLTIPLGVIIKRYRPSWSLLVAGLVTGGLIETTQYVISHLWLLNRSSDINDVIANAVGVMFGGVMYFGYAKMTK
ncbi:VanZ family protein [Lentilactobacillus senioris]|uniref:VanZ family protein n=1 Tax=Lentilactobacillus senioris TaxID=931534 RepID=UPI00227F78FA|nr:VanZ family protein [Lentilactobacillus senioris]MCY9806282.1 VanZ family protein [Lentilactobacillus senioris]